MRSDRPVPSRLQPLALRLFDSGAVVIDTKHGFELKDSSWSPIYFNLRVPGNSNPKGPLTPADVEMMARRLYGLAHRVAHPFDAVAGVPHAGNPFADAIARLYGVPRVVMSKSNDGTNRRVSGVYRKPDLPADAVVLLVDDVVTSSRSKAEAIDVLRAERLNVSDIVVGIDRRPGDPSEQPRVHNCALHALFHAAELLEFGVAEGKMQPSQRDYITRYLQLA